MSVEISVGACAIGTTVGALHKELRSARCSAICICVDGYATMRLRLWLRTKHKFSGRATFRGRKREPDP